MNGEYFQTITQTTRFESAFQSYGEIWVHDSWIKHRGRRLIQTFWDGLHVFLLSGVYCTRLSRLLYNYPRNCSIFIESQITRTNIFWAGATDLPAEWAISDRQKWKKSFWCSLSTQTLLRTGDGWGGTRTTTHRTAGVRVEFSQIREVREGKVQCRILTVQRFRFLGWNYSGVFRSRSEVTKELGWLNARRTDIVLQISDCMR